MPIKIYLQEAYLDYFNNYLSVERYAEDVGLSPDHAKTLIDLGRAIHESIVKDEQGGLDIDWEGNPIKHDEGGIDDRYRVTETATGSIDKPWAAYFCDEFLGSAATSVGAGRLCRTHNKQRKLKL